MFKSLLRFFGLAKENSRLDNFDPLYGLPKQSLDDWLSRNPKLKREYARKLAARGITLDVASASRRNNAVVC